MALCAGIVGSRRRNGLNDMRIVNSLVRWLVKRDRYLTVVSGGAMAGADLFAKDIAKRMGCDYVEFPVDVTGIKGKWEFTERAYARNRKIAWRSEEIYCLVHSDRTGGTENTIKHALEFQKKIFLVTETGEVYLSPDGKMPTCAPVVRLLDLKSTD